MPSIQWVDEFGLATLSPTDRVPRFANWTPRNRPIGPSRVGLGSGDLHRFTFRKDNIVSLEITPIPESEMEKMLRLQMHLLQGGAVYLLGTELHPSYGRFPSAKIAPGTEPEIIFSDRENLEWTFAATLRSSLVSASSAPPTEEPSLVFWAKANFESYAESDRVGRGTDWSGLANHADNLQGNILRPTFARNVSPNGGHAFEFHCGNNGNFSADANSDAVNGEPEYLRTPLLNIPADGLTVFIAGQRSGAHVEHTIFYRLATVEGAGGLCLKETHTTEGEGTQNQLKWDESGIIIPSSRGVSTEPFIHAIRIQSSTLASQFFMGEEVPGSTYNPSSQADVSNAIIIGGGNFWVFEIQAFAGAAGLIDTSMTRRFEYLSAEHDISLL